MDESDLDQPDVDQPDVISPTWISPTWISPTWISPTWISPTWISPTWISPDWISQPVITETSYLAQGTGTVTSGYDLDSLLQSLPNGAIMQVVVSKVSSAPGTDSLVSDDAGAIAARRQRHDNQRAANTSFSLAPGEQAIVTVRVACNGPLSEGVTPRREHRPRAHQTGAGLSHERLVRAGTSQVRAAEGSCRQSRHGAAGDHLLAVSPATVQGTGPGGRR